MALIKCSECGHEISDKASFCPHCGYPMEVDSDLKNNNDNESVDVEKEDVFVSEQMSKRNKINFKAVIPIMGLLVLALILGGYLYSRDLVPNLVNKEIEDAKALLDKQGIEYEIVYNRTDDYDKDIVYDQSIKAHSKNNGDVITLNVSKGKKIIMPDVVGKTEEEADKLLNNVEIIKNYKYTDDVEKGIVISASRLSGQEIYTDYQVQVNISKGKYKSVPNVIGKSMDEAIAVLSDEGLSYIIEEKFSARFKEGDVTDYTPFKYGDAAETTITLFVSKGGGVSVPNVQYKNLADAKKILDEANLEYSVKYTYDDLTTDPTCEKENKVKGQSATGVVESVDKITLYVNEPAITIKQINFDINYVGGVDTYITFQNISDKQIAYVDFEVQYYDRMGKPAKCSIRNSSVMNLNYTGPLNAGKTASNIYWDAVIYDASTGAIKPKAATITFEDGSKQKLTYDGTYWYANGYYGGDLKN